MKIFLKVMASLLVFLLTLELSSWGLLKSGFSNYRQAPTYRINIWQDFDEEVKSHPEYLSRASIYKKFLKRHPEIAITAPTDLALKSESVKYVLRGEKTGKLLFRHRVINSLVNDYYSIQGEFSGKTKYRVRYVTNEFGRRDPLGNVKKHPKKNLILLGCSFTWGEGVAQDKIFSSLINARFPDVQVYNAGIPGTAPSTFHKIMIDHSYEGLDGINTSLPTTVVYTFIDDHMKRIVGTSEYLARSEYPYNHEPYYYLDGEKLEFEQYFSSDFWSYRWAIKLLGHTHFAKATAIELPFIGDYHMKLTGKIFAEIKRELKKRFPELKDLIVTAFPASNTYSERLKVVLEKQGIPFLDFSETSIHSLMNGHEDLLYDPHPSAQLNELYADLLESELKSRL